MNIAAMARTENFAKRSPNHRQKMPKAPTISAAPSVKKMDPIPSFTKTMGVATKSASADAPKEITSDQGNTMAIVPSTMAAVNNRQKAVMSNGNQIGNPSISNSSVMFFPFFAFCTYGALFWNFGFDADKPLSHTILYHTESRFVKHFPFKKQKCSQFFQMVYIYLAYNK